VPQIGEIAWHLTGDIGGVGISRFRFVRQDAANIAGVDANAVAAASAALLTAVKAYIPANVIWSCSTQVNIYDVASGLVQGPIALSSPPANVASTSSGSYSGGAGARLNWKTSTLVGRRLIKGATFLVPVGVTGFAATGAVAPSLVTALNAAAATYLNAVTSATLYPVIWHRPKKGATVGGVTGIVFTGITSTTPAGLRSRRS